MWKSIYDVWCLPPDQCFPIWTSSRRTASASYSYSASSPSSPLKKRAPNERAVQLQLVIAELLHHSLPAHIRTVQQDHNKNISEQLLGKPPENRIESVSQQQPRTQDRCLRRRSLTALFPSSVSTSPSSSIYRLYRNRTRAKKSNIRKNMTAQVLSIPRDFTDNKGKEDPSFVLNGASVSVSYHTEVARLESFRNWTVLFINKAELARYGFYYVGPNDMVKCYFCRVEIGLWEPNDNVLSEHLRWSPYCPLLRKRQTNNVPIDASFLDQLPEPSYDTCGIRIRENSVAENAYSSSDRSSSGSLSSPPSSLTSESSMLSNGPIAQQHAAPALPQQKRPEYPNYAIEAKRLESYEDWPKFMKQKPKELSDAGFFYTGKSDRVKCFSCGGGLKDWEAEDEPWEQHAMWYSNCEYLKLMKGEEYIAQCLAKKVNPSEQKGSDVGPSNSPQPSTSGVASAATTSLPSSQSSSLSASAEEVNSPVGGSSSGMEEDEDEPNRKLDTNRICKICYVNEYNTAFSPCGHVVACAKCASSVTKCPLCRKPFTNVMRIYLM